MRYLVALLLVANLAFFAWARGWLAPGLQPPRHADHEPERLAAQVNAGAVKVLPPQTASAAVLAARAAAALCLEAGPLAEDGLAAAEAALLPAQLPAGSWLRLAAPTPPLWLVYAGRVPDAAARRKREAELRELGLQFERLDAPPALAPGLVLARHATRAEAVAALAALSAASQPLKGGRVLQLPAPAAQYWLRLPRADAETQSRVLALPADALAGGFRPCAPPAPP